MSSAEEALLGKERDEAGSEEHDHAKGDEYGYARPHDIEDFLRFFVKKKAHSCRIFPRTASVRVGGIIYQW